MPPDGAHLGDEEGYEMEGQELQINPFQVRSSTPTEACEDSCILLEVV